MVEPKYRDKYNSVAPRFIDQLAVDLVVSERRYMKLTSPERRHAAHRLSKMGMDHTVISEILRCTTRTVERMLEFPPPQILDVSLDGFYVTEDGEVLQPAVECSICSKPVYGMTGVCKYHRDQELRKGREARLSMSAG